MPRVKLFEPLASEGQSSEVIANSVKEGLRVRISDDWILRRIELHHIVTAIRAFIYITFSSTAERLNSVLLPLFHSSCVSIFYYWHTLAGMNPVASNTVATKVSDALYGVGFVANLHLIRLHSFLDLLSDVSESHINARRLDSGVSCVFYSRK